jgi:putative ABC transport system permease protein
LTATVQITGVGLGLMALLLLFVVRQDLLAAWQGQIAADAPNYFLINVQPGEVVALERYLKGHGGPDPRFYPMVRGRLIAINGREIDPNRYQDNRARRLVEREFNLSWTAEPAADNAVVAGRWWDAQPRDAQQFSVETGLSEELGIALGDALSFLVAGQQVTGTVTNLRRVEWDSFNVNFFVVGPPALLQGYPATYITSFYLPPEQQHLLPGLVRAFPSVTVIDVGTILAMARSIMEQGARVVELMAMLTLAAGVVVLLAALQITGEQRRFESALLRALGASRGRIRRLARAEFWLVGATAGLLAGAVAAVAGHVLAQQLFELDYPIRPLLLLIGVIAGAMVAWVAGALGSWRYYRGSPMQLLRQADEI